MNPYLRSAREAMGSFADLRASWAQEPRRLTVSRLGAPLLKARHATSFIARLRGLHGVPPLGPVDAMVIAPCRAVHTWHLGYPIDVAFLDSEGRILQLDALAPNRHAWCLQSHAVLEMARGTPARLSLGVGQILNIESLT